MAEIHVNSLDHILAKDEERVKVKKLNSAIQIIRFYIDDYEFALDIMDVKEIKEMDKIRNLPNSLPFVKGLLNLRGDIIPILDLKKKLEIENLTLQQIASLAEKQDLNNNKEDSEKNIEIKEDFKNLEDQNLKEEKIEKNENPSIIICKVGSENFGIVVDRIVRVQYLTQDEYEPTPVLFENIGKNFIKGFAKIDKKIVVILSIANLFF
ncbi:MAG TPA: chemotaxis protein CheW [Exilispira sp.]|nr:chemotaxis protein CheW [Exilispira sp.]